MGPMPASSQWEDDAFQGEKGLLAPEATAEATQFSARSDDAVAGDNDDDRVAAYRLTYGAGGERLADTFGDRPVGASLTVGDAGDFLPDPLLEGCAAQVQREVKGGALAVEVGFELVLCLQ